MLISLLLALPEPQAASVVLRWKAVENAVSYDLEISDDPRFGTLKLQTRVDTTGYRWLELPEKTHYFRVRSVDAQGNLGPYSEMKEIAAVWAPPAFSQPTPGTYALQRTLTFDFIPSLLFKRYRIEVATDAAFTRIVEDRTIEQPPLQIRVKGTGPLYYRMSAQNAADRIAGPGPVHLITFVPETPELRTADNLIVPPHQRAALAWSGSAGATAYRVQITSGKTTILDERVYGRHFNWRPTQNGELHWRVIAEDAVGRRSPPSARRKLSVIEAPASNVMTLADIDAGPLIGVFGGVAHNLGNIVYGQSGLLVGARIGAGIGDVLLAFSLGLAAQAGAFLLSAVPFLEYDFHIRDFRLRAGVGPAMNAVLMPNAPGQFALGVSTVLGLGWAFGRQEIGVEARYTWAPVPTYQTGGILVALCVWYGGT